MRKTNLVYLVALMAIFALACEENKSTPLSTQEAEGAKTGLQITATVVSKPEGQTISTVKNLAECAPTSYKYIDWRTLADNVPKVSPKTDAPPYNKPNKYFKDKITFQVDKNRLTITKKGGQVTECDFDADITDIAIGEDLSNPAAVVGTTNELKMAYISNIMQTEKDTLCNQFKSFKDALGILSIATATSPDFTIKLEKQTETIPSGLDLNLSKSINALPPGYKLSNDSSYIAADYIYFLTNQNWVGRIKPQMVKGGCVEYIWTGDIPAKHIAINDDELIITASDDTLLVRFNLLPQQ